jgi:hypothetical protein
VEIRMPIMRANAAISEGFSRHRFCLGLTWG